MPHSGNILLTLFLVYVAAQIGAEIAQRLKLPAVVGEIAAGCIIGPYALGWIKLEGNQMLEMQSEIGAVLLLFSVGLETRIGDLKKVGKLAVLVGVFGVIVPFALGTAWALASHFPLNRSLFIAAAFVATSAGITARVLQELKVLGRIESRIILGAAVVDDILAMLLLGVVNALNSGQGVRFGHIVFITVQAIGFVAVIALVGSRFIKRNSEMLDIPVNPLSPLTLSLALCLGLAASAEKFGLAAIIGAFLAGTVMAESNQRHSLERQIQPLLAFLVPFFFVITGAKVNLQALANFSVVLNVIVITLLAVVSKLIGCGLAAKSLGKQSAWIVGVGMVPRGEVGIIVASLGKQAGLFSDTIYAEIIMMSLLTSVIAPPLLKRLLADAAPEESEGDSYLFSIDESGNAGRSQQTNKKRKPDKEQ